MSKVEFKYSDSFREILKDIRGLAALELRKSENKKSDNLIDITDKKQFLKCVIGSHTNEFRCGKVIKRILPHLNNSDVEIFVNNYRSRIFKGTFSIIEGDDIKKYYRQETYYENPEANSSLYGSCMTNKPSTYFDIYTKNGVRLIILTDDESGKILGRSLLWDNVNNIEGISVMDKPYVSFQSLLIKFKDFAEENNFFFTDDLQDEDLFIISKQSEFENYPYCDTFTTIHPNKTLSNDKGDDELIDGEVYKILKETDGSCEEYYGYQYYINQNSDKTKTTFKYDIIDMCQFDNRSYLKDDLITIGNDKFHKSYKTLLNNPVFFIDKMSDFSDFRMTNLFLYHLKNKLGRRFFRPLYIDGFNDYDNILPHKIVGKRKREIIIPVRFGVPIVEFKSFLRIKIMPSGYCFSLMGSEMVEKKFSYFLGDGEKFSHKFMEEVLSDNTFYAFKSMTLKEFTNCYINQMEDDILRLIL